MARIVTVDAAGGIVTDTVSIAEAANRADPLPQPDLMLKPIINLWGKPADTTTRYCRHNLQFWLSNWYQVMESELARNNLAWAMAKADVLQAAARLPPRLRLLFNLYCLQAQEEYEILNGLHWSRLTLKREWRQMVDMILEILQDKRICSKPQPQWRNPMGRFGGAYWWEPVGSVRC